MTVAAITLAIIFALSAGVFGVFALRVEQIRWQKVTPYTGASFAVAGVISLIQALAFAAAVAYPSLLSAGYLALLAVSGVVLIAAVLVLGNKMGKK